MVGVLRSIKGQSTVEAAFLIPVLLGGILLLVQPGIVLYDRMIMESAAASACRLMTTLPEGDPAGQCKTFVLRRLSAVPQQDCFHVHGGGCSWEIETQGGETSETVTVTIRNRVKPLPLLSWGSALMGAQNGDGTWTIEVSRTEKTQPDWALASADGGPSTWIGAFL
ncbi:MAG: TadE/TadG family type IV pilus assembly protein [Coriobacteriia bacterium]|nr:TadE/TadG family type IV pilus assembly protein [Coriobacteriia bacterium]